MFQLPASSRQLPASSWRAKESAASLRHFGDEAQNLSLPLLEEIRILSELERRVKLLQVVLVGQPELRSNLRLPEMRQVDQRVSVRCELTSLDAAGVAGYVRHRLWIAGGGESCEAFTRQALEAIHEGSSGVPRLINRICDRALQRAFASRTMPVDAEFVWRAIDDLGLSSAIEVPDRAPHLTPAPAIVPPAAADEPAPPPPPFLEPKLAPPSHSAGRPLQFPAIEVTTLSDSDLSALAVFTEAASPVAENESTGHSGSRYHWMAAAAAVLAVSASIGVPAWYSRAGGIDGQDLAAMVPPRPTHRLSLTALLPLQVEASSLPPLRADAPVGDPDAAPTVFSSAPRPQSGYSIVVASFENRNRAERLAADLVTAGYGARPVERNGDRLVQVTIGGYTSAIDVQRDLQRIRELPGGYGDARIVQPD